MSKIIYGMVLEDFTFNTPFEKNKTLYQLISKVEEKTVILFLRYYGCTLCQMDIHNFIKEYNKIKATGSQLVIVLQSSPESINTTATSSDFPFEIICDSDAILYTKYDINSATSKMSMVDGKTIVKVLKATFGGFKHGAYEGDEQQLPATFIVNKNAKVLYSQYGTSAGDIPTVNQLINLLTKSNI